MNIWAFIRIPKRSSFSPNLSLEGTWKIIPNLNPRAGATTRRTRQPPRVHCHLGRPAAGDPLPSLCSQQLSQSQHNRQSLPSPSVQCQRRSGGGELCLCPDWIKWRKERKHLLCLWSSQCQTASDLSVCVSPSPPVSDHVPLQPASSASLSGQSHTPHCPFSPAIPPLPLPQPFQRCPGLGAFSLCCAGTLQDQSFQHPLCW